MGKYELDTGELQISAEEYWAKRHTKTFLEVQRRAFKHKELDVSCLQHGHA